MRQSVRLAWLIGATLLVPILPVKAQQPPPTTQPPAQNGDEDEIVVNGKPARGSVLGDIPPENTLFSRDVKATGATNFDELLEALAPQISSALGSGERPVVLLNGRRVSSYRELRDIPIEAISRVDILPEEVALKYGYHADQKVVNIVLSKRFRSTTAQVAANAASGRQYTGGSGDVTRMQVDQDTRTTINAHVGGDDILSASQQRLVGQDQGSASSAANGTALPSAFRIRTGITANRDLGHDVEASINAEADHDVGHSLANVAGQLPGKLDRTTTTDSAHVGAVLNGDGGPWHWNLVANGDLQHSNTQTEASQPQIAPADGRSTYAAGELDGTINGDLFALPAGQASATFRAAVSEAGLDVHQAGVGERAPDSTSRTTATAGASIDLPISHRERSFSALGNLTLNGNAEINETSHFGTLATVGAGLNWSPLPRLNLIGSWSHEEDAPSIRQLGDPIVQTPEVSLFDFTNGSMVHTNVITGGNPDLKSSTRHMIKLSGTWQPLENVDFKLRAEYAHLDIDRPIIALTTSPAIEAAFPERFIRDSSGQLISADIRSVNFDSERRDSLRVGFDFTKPLRSRSVTAAEVERALEKARRSGINVPEPAPVSAAPAGGSASLGDVYKTHGRLTFSLTDTITLADSAVIAPGTPRLDFLHGGAIGQTGGQPRHQVEAQAGWSNNGLGARVGFNWRSATDVDTLDAGPLHFSPFATFDLRLFANVGQDVALVAKHPWLAGSSIRFEAGNVLNARPRVHDAAGDVPLNYDPDELDPLGRTLMISFRKQFLPQSYYRDQLKKFEQSQQPQ